MIRNALLASLLLVTLSPLALAEATSTTELVTCIDLGGCEGSNSWAEISGYVEGIYVCLNSSLAPTAYCDSA